MEQQKWPVFRFMVARESGQVTKASEVAKPPTRETLQTEKALSTGSVLVPQRNVTSCRVFKGHPKN
jgi:hypothetical protein